MQPKISPGESGFERGIITSYLPVRRLEVPSDSESGVSLFSLPKTRSSLSFCNAETNWIVETNASRVGSCGHSRAYPYFGTSLVDDEAWIRRYCVFPIFWPAGISTSVSSESISCSWNVARSLGKFRRTVSARCVESMAISTNT